VERIKETHPDLYEEYYRARFNETELAKVDFKLAEREILEGKGGILRFGSEEFS
jgi:hypothetical protein